MFKKNRQKPNLNNAESLENNNVVKKHNVPPSPVSPVSKATLQFHCQLAHGSPTVFISGFSNVKELYQKIAESFDFPASEILFCTLNTYKADMKKLLGGQIGLEDFIFAHKKECIGELKSVGIETIEGVIFRRNAKPKLIFPVKIRHFVGVTWQQFKTITTIILITTDFVPKASRGRPKEVELVKTEDALGLTITDNGAGYAFIKRIKEGSVIHSIPHIQVGDHIEKLNGEVMVGKRHFEVAKILKDIPRGATFTIRLVEPMKSGFNSIAPKSSARGGSKKSNYGTGRETLRFKAGGNAEIEEKDDQMDIGVEKINTILESFLGINDEELATRIWEIAVGKTNSMDFADAVDNSDLEELGFTDDLVIELWGAITDARDGRI